MIGLQKKRPTGEYVVPNNSVLHLPHKSVMYDPSPNNMERCAGGIGSGGISPANKCRYCENMAKNFLYLESLIRNNGEKNASGHKTCNLCNSSLKYLEYVNRNIRQVFGDFDSIIQADRALAAKPAVMPKYSVGSNQPQQVQTPEKAEPRARGGAILAAQKSVTRSRSTLSRTKEKSKSQKSLKSLKTLKSKEKALKALKGMKGLKNTKSAKVPKSVKGQKSMKSLKSQKSLKIAKSASITKSKTGTIGRGKKILKRKFRGKAGGKAASGPKMVRSVSQYRNLGRIRAKLSKASSHKKLAKQRSQASPPPSINWRLLKRNLPKSQVLLR
ncbi:hypothetical protein KR018_011519 [Drosophila ironensis]|nr:hypothetical protein KR018_011519 [Drosophila ironensis]